VEIDARRVRPDQSEVQRLISGPFLASKLLDWHPRVELGEGIRHTVEWMERNAHRFRVGHYVI
jgi:dTDP-glucose 4,6-dehydratase